MKRILILRCTPADLTAAELEAEQRALPGVDVVVEDLCVEAVDWVRVLDAVLAADSVQVW